MDRMNTKFDIIIQAGQSNAEGYGTGPADEALVPKFSGNVWQLQPLWTSEVVDGHLQVRYDDVPYQITPAAEIVTATSIRGNFAWTFAEEFEKAGFLEEGRQLLIIKAAVGGSGFNDGLWGLDKLLYRKMIEMTDYALSLNQENRVIGFLWHQGENEASPVTDFKWFRERLQEMFVDVRSRYGAEIPIIAGDFVQDWKQKNLERCNPAIETICEVLAEMGNAGFVETSDLESNAQKLQNEDDIHFCREALCILGKRYFEAFQELGKKGR